MIKGPTLQKSFITNVKTDIFDKIINFNLSKRFKSSVSNQIIKPLKLFVFWTKSLFFLAFCLNVVFFTRNYTTPSIYIISENIKYQVFSFQFLVLYNKKKKRKTKRWGYKENLNDRMYLKVKANFNSFTNKIPNEICVWSRWEDIPKFDYGWLFQLFIIRRKV